jgi:ribonuclease P protein component
MFHESTQRIRLGSFYIFKKDGQGEPRLGITVKTNQGSVVRNLLKRVVRESFRIKRGTLPSFDYNIVIQVNKPIEDKKAYLGRLRRALDTFWKSESKYEKTGS